MPKGEGTRAWRKSGRQRAGAKIADPQDLEGMVKAVLLASQFPVGPIMTHRQSASRRCCPCQRLSNGLTSTQDGDTHLRGQDGGECILITARMDHLRSCYDR